VPASYGNGNEEREEMDRVVEAEIVMRAVTMVWKEVMQAYVEGALRLEQERSWWDASLMSRRGVGIYLLQSRCAGVLFPLPLGPA
jgi:nuclear-control-of-ATPase protein 2